MGKIFGVLIIATLLSGCYENTSNSQQFNWAVVNKMALEKEIKSRVERLNPYPGEIGMDKDKLYDERRRLSRQINELLSAAQEKCLMSQKESKQENGQTNSARDNYSTYSGSSAPSVIPRSISMRRDTAFRQRCLSSAKSDPLVKDLKKRKEKLEDISKMQKKHDRRVREFSEKYVLQLIGHSSKSKYEVVVNGKDDTVLYNSTGLVLDITDSLMAEIDEKSLVLTDGNSEQ